MRETPRSEAHRQRVFLTCLVPVAGIRRPPNPLPNVGSEGLRGKSARLRPPGWLAESGPGLFSRRRAEFVTADARISAAADENRNRPARTSIFPGTAIVASYPLVSLLT